MTPLDPRDDAFVLARELPDLSEPVAELDHHGALAAVEDEFLLLGGELGERLVEVDALLLGHRLEHPVEVAGVRAAPRGDGTVRQGQRIVGDDQVGVHLELGPQPVAVGAGAERRVEREVPRRGLLEAVAALRTGQVLGEGENLVLGLVLCHQLDLGDTLREAKCCLERVGQAAVDVVAAHQAVDHDLDGVLLVAGEFRARLQELPDVVHLAVDPGPDEPLSCDVGEQRVVFALPAPHHRSENLEPRPLRQPHDAVDDLLGSLALEARAVGRTVLHADAGPQEPQVVVHLGDGPDRGPGVA